MEKTVCYSLPQGCCPGFLSQSLGNCLQRFHWPVLALPLFHAEMLSAPHSATGANGQMFIHALEPELLTAWPTYIGPIPQARAPTCANGGEDSNMDHICYLLFCPTPWKNTRFIVIFANISTGSRKNCLWIHNSPIRRSLIQSHFSPVTGSNGTQYRIQKLIYIFYALCRVSQSRFLPALLYGVILNIQYEMAEMNVWATSYNA